MIINTLKDYLIRILYRNLRPRMLVGYRTKGRPNDPTIRIGSTTQIESPENFFPESDIYIGQFNFIEASHGIHIGNGCQITNYVSIVTHSSHISIRLLGPKYSSSAKLIGYLTGSIEIGDYTFVGPHTVIMPDTIIGKACIVKAFSYVKGRFPDYSIIGGNPATILGDTRNLDKPFLEDHPEMVENYRKTISNIQ